MADPTAPKPSGASPQSPPSSGGDGWLLVLYGLLIVGGLVLLAMGLVAFFRDGDSRLLGPGVLAVIVPAGLYPIASALTGNRGGAAAGDGQSTELLRSINERLMISDTAKRIAYREKDREALREAIKHDIEKRDFEGALVMVNQMSQVYGYRLEAEQIRSEIEQARAEEMRHRVDEAIGHVDKLINVHEWDAALTEAQKVQRMFPGEKRVEALPQRVSAGREQYIKQLEREFLESANRDEIDRAMNLLKELDRYLTEEEAEPFREVARGVITKARQNLGVQFKLAVHDKEWTRAVQVGEHILREFPTSKMAEEVRGMLDIMRERAAGEQAARPATT